MIVGGIFGICLYYISSGKFTKAHVFILFLNNYLGPDVGWVFGIGFFTHTLFVWPFFALALATIYRYFTRFSLKIDGIKKMEIIDLERPELSYLNTYLIVLAAGIMHIHLDDLLNYNGVFVIMPQFSSTLKGLTWTLEDFTNFWKVGLFQINIVLVFIIGISFIFGFVFVFVWYLKKMSKKEGMLLILYVIAFMVFYYLAGSLTTVFHPDAGAIIYVSLFWLMPLILSVLSTREFKFLKERRIIFSKSTHLFEKKGISVILIYLYLVAGILCTFGGLLSMIFIENLLNYLLKTAIFDITDAFQIYIAVILINISLLTIGIVEILSWNYLRKCENQYRKLLIIVLWLFASGLFGLIFSLIALFLNEPIVTYIFSLYGQIISTYFSFEEILLLLTISGTIFLIVSLLNFICAIGLTIKNKGIWKLSTWYHLIFSWTIIGLLIACAINENSVKIAFNVKE